MSILIKLYVLSEFFFLFLALNVCFSAKKNVLNQKYFNYQAFKTSQSITQQTKVFQDLGEFFDFNQSIIDIGNLLQVSVFLCIEESNLNLGRLVQTVLLECDTHPPHAVCCYFVYSITDVQHLIHY